MATDENYCIFNTSQSYDGEYNLSLTYNGYNYFTGLTNGYFIYYSLTEDSWCLSLSLGGTCDQFGPSGVGSTFPDLDSGFFFSGLCPTTTTTTTSACDSFDFNAIFNCLVSQTPTPTPTNTPTPTPTPTPTTSNPCGGFLIDVMITGYTPTPTPTNTPTPTPSPEVTRPCDINGIVNFNIFDEYMRCGNTKKFVDCFTGLEYYTTQILLDSSGNTISEGYVYSTYINGIGICATFEGLVDNISGIDNIQIVGLIGPFNQGACLDCITPTPDPILECLIMNSECGTVNVNPGTFINGKLSYTWSFPFPISPQYIYNIYWDNINGRWNATETTTNILGAYLEIDSVLPIGTTLEWVIVLNTNPSVDCFDLNFNTTLLSVPCPSPTPTTTTTTTISPCIITEYLLVNQAATSQEYQYTICGDKPPIDGMIQSYQSLIICSSTIPIGYNPSLQITPTGNICG
jgi:hypothetical protein